MTDHTDKLPESTCGCCQCECEPVMMVADEEFGRVCPSCDLYLMEQECEGKRQAEKDHAKR